MVLNTSKENCPTVLNEFLEYVAKISAQSVISGMEMKPKNPVFWRAIESSKLSETFIWMYCELETFRKNCDRFYLNVFPIVCSTFVYWNHNRFYHKCISNPVILVLFNISWQVSFQMYFQSCDLFVQYIMTCFICFKWMYSELETVK